MDLEKLSQAVELASVTNVDHMYLYGELKTTSLGMVKVSATVLSNKEFTEYLIFSNLVMITRHDDAETLETKERFKFYISDDMVEGYDAYQAMEWILKFIIDKNAEYDPSATFLFHTQYKLIQRGVAKSLNDLLEEINPENPKKTVV